MDLLCKTYSNSSDDEKEEEQKPSKFIPPPLKRLKPYYSAAPETLFQGPNPRIGAPNPIPGNGRYISKREKALMASSSSSTHLNPPPSLPSSHGMSLSFSQFPLFF